ncbi:MAG: iron-containing redox enzyme family protein [Alphaproteobacteria bacterium]|nr:iron-containing redox enzyme family protein [Alphaproteobacteria bacterium]
MYGPDEFEDKMAETIWENRWKTHTAYETFIQHHMCIEGAKVYAREHAVFANHFPRWFGSMVANCPSLSARAYMIENMYVEEVTDPEVENGHYESLIDFGVALGYQRDFLYAYKGAIYTRLALAYWERATRAWPWTEAFAAVAGLEAARGPLVLKRGNCIPNNRAVWRPLGLPEEALAHWSAAEAADYSSGGHGDMTLKILSEHCTTEAQQQRILEVLAETMQVRSYHFDQIGRDALKAAGAPLEAVA